MVDLESNHGLVHSKILERAIRYYEVLGPIYYKEAFPGFSRQQEELTKKRFRGINVSIDNLGDLINALASLISNNNLIKGVDLGSGNHFFVDYVRRKFRWDAIAIDRFSYAINLAREKYPESAEFYLVRDFLSPEPLFKDGSQNFVFCNAVIQHFDDSELNLFFKKVAKMLVEGGILLLIFKRKVGWKILKEKGLKINILDEKRGLIELEEPAIKEAIRNAAEEVKVKLTQSQIKGMREFRFFTPAELVFLATRYELQVVEKMPFGNPQWPGIVEYESGRGIPTAAIFFRRTKLLISD